MSTPDYETDLRGLLFIFLLNIASSFSCNPWVEEGKQWTMDCPAVDLSRPVVFSVKLNDGRSIQFARCNQTEHCISSSTLYNASVVSQNSSGTYATFFTINQVNRTFVSAACLVDSKEVKLCTFWIYAKPEKPVCFPPTLTDKNTTLTMICSTARVYPEVGCYIRHFQSRNQLMGQVYTRINELPDDNGDKSANCTVILSLNGTEASDEMFIVTMYPRNGEPPNDTSLLVDSDWTDVIKFQLPEVAELKNCTSGRIKLGSEASCRCELKEPGYPAGQAQWFSSKLPVGIYNSDDRSSTLKITYDPKDPTPTYECGAISIIKGEPGRKTYSPIFASAPANVTITVTNDGMFDLCPLTLDKVYVTCTSPYEQPTSPAFTALFDDVTINQSTPVTTTSTSYSVMYNFRPISSGRHQITCRASDPLFKDLATLSTKTLTVRAPPPSPPQVTVSNNQLTTVNDTVRVTEGDRIIVSCQVDGGYPQVVTATLDCVFKAAPVGGNPIHWTMTATKDMNGLSCQCTAKHDTGCYDLKTQVTFVVESASDDTQTLGLAIGLGSAGFLIIVVTIVVIVCIRNRQQYQANPPSKDNENKHYNDLTDHSTGYSSADNISLYQELTDYAQLEYRQPPITNVLKNGQNSVGWPSGEPWSTYESSNYQSSTPWPSSGQTSTNWTSSGQDSASINWSDYKQPRPPLCRVDKSKAENDYIHVI